MKYKKADNKLTIKAKTKLNKRFALPFSEAELVNKLTKENADVNELATLTAIELSD